MSARPRAIHPGRLRRRLTLAFALTAGIAAAALAAGSFLLVREARLDDSRDRAVEQTRFNLVLAAEVLPADGPEALLDAYARRGSFETVLQVEGTSYPSSLSLSIEQVPPDLKELVARGQLAYERTDVAETPYLVTGGRVAGTEADEAYFFFSEEELHDDLADLRNILLAGLGIVVLVGALAGALVARRTLAPVARASAAAHSLAEGLLDTRLPVERTDELGLWALSFNQMADALEAKITALSEAQARERRFTADVAHELRTPLTAIVNEASLLGEHLERMPAEARRPAELLVEDVKRLRDLVEDLMEISRLDAGTQPVRPERVDLGSLVGAAIRARGWQDRVELRRGRGRARDGPPQGRAHRRQPGRERPRARRARRLRPRRQGRPGGVRRGRRPRLRRRSGGPAAPLRALLQGRPGPDGARDRPRPGDRARERPPPGRRHRGLERGRRRLALHAPAACCRTVTRR